MVRSIEIEKMEFFNSLSGIGYHRARDALKKIPSTMIRDTIGHSAIPSHMDDFENVIYPRLKLAMVMCKPHGLQPRTHRPVTEYTILQQWMEESIQNVASIVERAMMAVKCNPENFDWVQIVPTTLKDCFPKIHEWKILHKRQLTLGCQMNTAPTRRLNTSSILPGPSNISLVWKSPSHTRRCPTEVVHTCGSRTNTSTSPTRRKTSPHRRIRRCTTSPMRRDVTSPTPCFRN